MDDLRPEQSLEDSEIEITPLPQLDTTTNSNAANTPLSPHPPVRPQLSPRQRTVALRLAVVVSIMLLALLVFPGSFPTLRNVINNLVPTPTPTLPPGYNLFYMDVSVPWTRVSVDGHLVHPSRISDQAPIWLARGHHVIEWRAEPFQLQSCTISIPYANSDTCRFANDTVIQQQTIGPVQLILLHESLTTLSADQQAALIEAVQAALDGSYASETIQLGEKYIVPGPNGYVTATRPLRATLHFQLDTDVSNPSGAFCLLNAQTMAPQLCNVDGQNCEQLCTAPLQFRESQAATPFASAWLAFIMVSASWDYATESGQIIAHDQPIGQSYANFSDQLVLLNIGWGNSGWHVKVLFGPSLGSAPIVDRGINNGPSSTEDIQIAADPACVDAQAIFVQDLSNYSQIRFVSGENPAAGCLVVATGSLTNTPTSSNPAVAYFLDRFGVLLAANDVAHKLQPQWPLVNAYERSLVQQLATLPGQTVAAFPSG